MTFIYDLCNALWKTVVIFVYSYAMLTCCHMCRGITKRTRIIELKLFTYIITFIILCMIVAYAVDVSNIGNLLLYNLLLNN